LLDDKKWKVRIAAYETISDLALFYQSYDIFFKTLEPLFVLYLKDRAQIIREFGIKKIPALIQVYKIEWVYNGLLPRLNEALHKDNGYLFRITALQTLQAVAQSISPDVANDKILPLILKCGKDSVANVRFTVIKVLKVLHSKSDSVK